MALNKIFANLSNDLKSNNSGEKFVERLLQVLAAKTSSGTFPRDEEFKERFIYKNMYNTSIDKYTLVKIENYNSKENVEISNSITIEHVMPQKLTPQWQIELGKKFENIHSKYLHTIGNLTLSGYNSELSNNSFASKKEIFIESNINMSRNICEFNEWNETTIVQRATNMFETALKLWEFPKKYQSKETVGIDYSTPYLITTDIKVTGEKPRLLIIDDIEHTVSSGKDVLRFYVKNCMT